MSIVFFYINLLTVTVQPPPGQRIVLWRRPCKGRRLLKVVLHFSEKMAQPYLSLVPLPPLVKRKRASKENDALSGRRLNCYYLRQSTFGSSPTSTR